jgi:hypothetical protein
VLAKFATYETYEQLEEARRHYEKDKFVTLYERHSRSAHGVRKLSEKRQINQKITIV